jgi:hypothetical protein
LPDTNLVGVGDFAYAEWYVTLDDLSDYHGRAHEDCEVCEYLADMDYLSNCDALTDALNWGPK